MTTNMHIKRNLERRLEKTTTTKSLDFKIRINKWNRQSKGRGPRKVRGRFN